jgi:hypothetical protein
MAAARGTLVKVGIDTSDPVTKMYDVQSESLAMNEEVINANGLRGTAAHSSERVRAGLQRIAGNLLFKPSSVELASLLAWFTGGTPSGTPTVTYPLGENMTENFVTIDRQLKVFTYAGCKPDVTVIRGRKGEAIEIEMDLVGRTETVANAGTFPAITIDTTTYPFVFSDAAVTINGTASSKASEFTITYERQIDRERFFAGSNAMPTVENYDRRVMLEFMVPYGDHSAFYAAGFDVDGVAIVITLTNGSAVWTMTFASVIFPRISPVTPGREEIMMSIRGQAFKVGTTLEVVNTLNPGP